MDPALHYILCLLLAIDLHMLHYNQVHTQYDIDRRCGEVKISGHMAYFG